MEIFENDGMNCIMPVTVYPEGYVKTILANVDDIRISIQEGKQTVFTNVKDLIASLEHK